MDPNNIPGGSSKGKSISSRAKKEPMKVKYISSPIMVQASNESEFRAVVQELTGKNSPGTHPGTTVAPATTTTGSHGGQGGGGGGGGGGNCFSGFHDQNMMWKDF